MSHLFTGRVRQALADATSCIAHRRVVPWFDWILGFTIKRFTIVDFRDVGLLGV